MNDITQANKRGGKRRPQIFTERAVARALRAAGQDRILRIRPDGTLELVPMSGDKPPGTEAEDLDRELKEFQARHGQG